MKRLLIIAVMATAIFVSQISLAQDSEESPNGVLSSAGNRFVFGQISTFGRDKFMLDTETGRLWQLAVDANKNRLLQNVPYRMVNGKNCLNAPSEDVDLKSINK